MRPAFVHSPAYDFRLPDFGPAVEQAGLHAFDGLRAQRAWALFESAGALPAGAHLQPREVSAAELRLVHDEAYLASLADPGAIAEILEIPFAALAPIELLERCVLGPMRLATGGTIAAVAHALEHGLALQLGGGYHHAQHERGEGFCVYNDIAIAVQVARRARGGLRVLVIDLDAHQGNGVERIFAGDPELEVFDVYNAEVFPFDEVAREATRWDHPLPFDAQGGPYLELLERQLPRALDEFEPELVVYNAGTDVVRGDPLGGLGLAPADVLRRDLFVLEQAVGRSLPIATVPSGGYTQESHRLIARTLTAVRSRWC